jgi:hypothetical protein
MSKHLLWLWLLFFFGSLMYMVKRAFYLITGPNPVANNVKDFIKVAGVPLAFRFVVDSAFYWALFYPDLINPVLTKLGISFQIHSSMASLPGFVALLIGLGIDPMADWFIGTVVSKIPLLKDWWPQMPPALPKTP